ncbi:MAG: hypothetical protein AAGJ67_06480 [Pseudomonadota bacterium]
MNNWLLCIASGTCQVWIVTYAQKNALTQNKICSVMKKREYQQRFTCKGKERNYQADLAIKNDEASLTSAE